MAKGVKFTELNTEFLDEPKIDTSKMKCEGHSVGNEIIELSDKMSGLSKKLDIASCRYAESQNKKNTAFLSNALARIVKTAGEMQAIIDNESSASE